MVGIDQTHRSFRVLMGFWRLAQHLDAIDHPTRIVVGGFPDMTLLLIHSFRIGIGGIVVPSSIGFINQMGVDVLP